jgi:hypothetical protein
VDGATWKWVAISGLMAWGKYTLATLTPQAAAMTATAGRERPLVRSVATGAEATVTRLPRPVL